VRFADGDCGAAGGAAGGAGLVYCPADLRARGALDTVCVAGELARGARVFLLEAHLRRGELRVCSAWCSVRPQRAEELLGVFAAFLRANAREVLVLWWYPGGERGAVLHELGLAYRRTGLAAFSFESAEEAWPTFAELVARNRRVVTLVEAADGDGGAARDAASESFMFVTGAMDELRD
jgi:hypothetical protein